jgi:hypothetical protein
MLRGIPQRPVKFSSNWIGAISAAVKDVSRDLFVSRNRATARLLPSCGNAPTCGENP